MYSDKCVLKKKKDRIVTIDIDKKSRFFKT